jgi:hypothetical protein
MIKGFAKLIPYILKVEDYGEFAEISCKPRFKGF